MLTTARQHSEGDLPYPTPKDSYLIGFGIGAIAAATISTSNDVSSIIPAAVYAVRLALHVCLRADHEAQSIKGRKSSESWATEVAGISFEELSGVIQHFNLSEVEKPNTAYLTSSLTNDLGPSSVISHLYLMHIS